jgi:hypothetical protein
MLIFALVGCMTRVHVQASMPEADVGIIRSSSMPQPDALAAQIRGVGEASGMVSYTAFDDYWGWARVEGGEPTIGKIPSELSTGPLVTCFVGILLWPLLVGCFFVSKPTSAVLLLHVNAPTPEGPPPIAVLEPANLTIPVSEASRLGTDIGSKLVELKALYDQGLITEEEYAAKRKALLDGL